VKETNIMTQYNATLVTKTEYVTWVNGTDLYTGPNLEDAIRAWDRHLVIGGKDAGGISVQSWSDGVMVRDGWILHIYDNGQVYLSPTITSK
jgi:hypothetical protein